MADPGKDWDALLGRAVRDNSFREQLMTDPEGAASGYDISEDQLADLKEANKDASANFFATMGSEVGGLAKKSDWCTEKACNDGGD